MTDITTQETSKNKTNQVVRNEKGQVIEGTPNPNGRPKLTEEEKAIRRAEKEAVKKYIAEYEMGLAEALPEIEPKLIELAIKGNMTAIREIHEVVGAHKNKGGNTIVPIQINFNDGDLQ